MKSHTPHFPELIRHVRSYEIKHKLLLSLSFMIFFFLVCDGIVGYFVPIAMTQAGLNEFQIGLIVSTSSMAGLVFDQMLLRVFKQTHFRRMFLFMFLFALLLPLIIWKTTSPLMFVVGMAVWGIYYDLYSCGTMDFVGTVTQKNEHSSSYGVIAVFISCAYIISPLIASSLVDSMSAGTPFYIAYVFLGVAFLLYSYLKSASQKKIEASFPEEKKFMSKHERSTFLQTVWVLMPILSITTMLNIVAAMYWTFAPLIDHVGTSTWSLGGFLMFAYQLPSLLSGWFVGSLTKKISKNKLSLLMLFGGSVFLMSFFLLQNPYILILASFFSSLFLSLVWPSINGIYADCVTHVPEREVQIETAQDSFGNIGYIIGPLMAGVVAQNFGTIQTFAWIGVLGVVLSMGLWFFAPKQIRFA